MRKIQLALIAASMPMTAIGLVLSTSAAYARASEQRTYHLPAQSLAASLRDLAVASGRSIVAPAELISEKQAPALDGVYTVETAAKALLAGSGLRARPIADGFVIERAGAVAELDRGATAAATDIVVTGSRIRGAPVASPVISISQRQMRDEGQSSLGQVVRSLPQSFGGGQQPGLGLNVPGASGVDVGGASSINLRGLGSDATLTLLNGRRLSYSGSRQSIDVSAVPFNIIERIEIVPDGASAIYGSDAVAGVANIILKRDYQGFEARGALGGSTDGGYFTQSYGALAGRTWSTGGFALAYQYDANTLIDSADRSYARTRSPGLTLYPSLKNHSVLLTGHQAVGDLTFAIDVLYNRRREFSAYPLDISGDLSLTRGETAASTMAYAIAPSIDWSVGDRWHLSLAGSYAEDHANFVSDTYVGPALDSRTKGCYCNKGQSAEFSATGPLATLPGGDLRTALGVGYRNNDFNFFAGVGNSQNIERAQASRYAYAELSLPVVSAAMAIRGIVRLSLTSAVRYERYPGFGSVATPKFGLIYAPDDTFELRGSWGQSFRAPTLRQQYQPKAVSILRPSALGGSGFPAGSAVAYASGGNPALRPEQATSWSATLAIHPPALGGAKLEISYFDTVYQDRIVTPIALRSQALTNPIYRDYVTLHPTVAQVTALVASANSFFNQSGAPYDPATVLAVADASNVNAGRQHIHGIDALLSYELPIGGGDKAIALTANASYLTSDQRIADAQPMTTLAGNIFNPPHFRARGSASWRDGGFTLTGTISYIGGINDIRRTPTVAIPGMTPIDLTARYRTGRTGLLGGFDIALSVQNLFNEKPGTIIGQFYEAPYDSTNYSPVGRYISLSIAKSW